MSVENRELCESRRLKPEWHHASRKLRLSYLTDLDDHGVVLSEDAMYY